jgi:branched-chain amino acid transport system permease protein
MDYAYGVVTLIAIYSMLSVSLSLLIGHTGIFSMATAGIFGIGAYTEAILTVDLGWPFIPAMLVAIVAGVLVSAIAAIPTLRVSGDYFIVASLALQILIVNMIGNLDGLTGGTAGKVGVLRPEIGSLDFSSAESFLVLTLVIAALAIGVCAVVVHSPFGRVLRALHDDDTAAAAMAKKVVSPKLGVVFLVGAVGALAGGLYACYLQFLAPESFALNLSVVVVSMVVVGGTRSVLGCILGAALVVLLPELLQVVDFSANLAGPIQQAVFGALLVLFAFFRPGGLVPPGIVTRMRAKRAVDDRPRERIDVTV